MSIFQIYDFRQIVINGFKTTFGQFGQLSWWGSLIKNKESLKNFSPVTILILYDYNCVKKIKKQIQQRNWNFRAYLGQLRKEIEVITATPSLWWGSFSPPTPQNHPTIFLYWGVYGAVILNLWLGIKVRGYFWKNHKRSIYDNFNFEIVENFWKISNFFEFFFI